MTDVCNCEYTSHGHCGKIVNGDVDNDTTLEWLAASALSHVRGGRRYRRAVGHDGWPRGGDPAGARCERISRTRRFCRTRRSLRRCFTGRSARPRNRRPQFGDRRSYQMDPANGREAMREIELDLEEGADMIMVKPAMPYLDLIRQARDRFDVPISAYQVSGEYSMIMAAARNGWIDQERAMMESLTSIRRAGADFILTYFSKPMARLLG